MEKNDLSFGTDKIISVASMHYKEDTSNSDDDYMRTYNVMRLGDIAFEGNKSKNFAHGRFVENTIGDGIVSHVFDVFRPISEYDLLFWKYFINYEGVMGRIMIRCTKASTMMTNLVAKDFLEESIVVPSIVEQKRIGYYLKSLDHLITLHQSKSFGHILKVIVSCTLYWEQRKLGEMYTQLVERNIELLPFEKILSASTMSYKVDGSGAAEESLSNYKRLRVGDIAFEGHTSKDFRYGRFVLNDTGDGIMSPRFSALRPICVMPIKFWKYYIHYDPIMKNILVNSTKSGTMMNELVVEEFLKEILLVPEEYEQQKIGIFFNRLDHLITLHQRKLEKLKIIKKSMLENLFPQNGEKTPKIRFSGFTEDWEQRKLGEIAERIIRKNEKLESTLPLTISAQYGLIDQNEFFDKRIASKDVRSYYLIKKGEFAYNKSTSVDAPLGAIKRLDKYKNGVLSTLYILFKIIDDTSTSSDYLVTYYATDLWHRGIQSIAAEGARNHGLLNIAPNDFFETILSIPLNVSEQKKVGDFFMSLDRLITLHQSKLEKLQKIKKSMLESMFV